MKCLSVLGIPLPLHPFCVFSKTSLWQVGFARMVEREAALTLTSMGPRPEPRRPRLSPFSSFRYQDILSRPGNWVRPAPAQSAHCQDRWAAWRLTGHSLCLQHRDSFSAKPTIPGPPKGMVLKDKVRQVSRMKAHTMILSASRFLAIVHSFLGLVIKSVGGSGR